MGNWEKGICKSDIDMCLGYQLSIPFKNLEFWELLGKKNVVGFFLFLFFFVFCFFMVYFDSQKIYAQLVLKSAFIFMRIIS